LARTASSFWRVADVLERFLAQDCEVRVAEAKVMLEDGDCLNVRYLLSPNKSDFVPLVDLGDDEFVSATEVSFWERRVGVSIDKRGL